MSPSHDHIIQYLLSPTSLAIDNHAVEADHRIHSLRKNAWYCKLNNPCMRTCRPLCSDRSPLSTVCLRALLAAVQSALLTPSLSGNYPLSVVCTLSAACGLVKADFARPYFEALIVSHLRLTLFSSTTDATLSRLLDA
jgi:hypothetical protein